MSQGFTKNFAQLASVRFILGLVEGMFCWQSQCFKQSICPSWHADLFGLQHHFYLLCSCCLAHGGTLFFSVVLPLGLCVYMHTQDGHLISAALSVVVNY